MNTPSDIPNGERIDTADTELDLPDLPGPWEWKSANHYADFNGKVNVYFGHSFHSVGGQIGEIDNYHDGDSMVWEIHIREIESAPTANESGTLPAESADVTQQHDTLGEAIEAVPEVVSTYYATEHAGGGA